MKCKKILDNNEHCRAFAQKGKEFCFRHDPNASEAKLAASSKGGQNRVLQGIYGEEVKLESPADIKLFLGKVINGVWTGQVPVPVGSSMGFLARCWLDSHESAVVDKKIDDLEDKLNKINSSNHF